MESPGMQLPSIPLKAFKHQKTSLVLGVSKSKLKGLSFCVWSFSPACQVLEGRPSPSPSLLTHLPPHFSPLYYPYLSLRLPPHLSHPYLPLHLIPPCCLRCDVLLLASPTSRVAHPLMVERLSIIKSVLRGGLMSAPVST